MNMPERLVHYVVTEADHARRKLNDLCREHEGIRIDGEGSFEGHKKTLERLLEAEALLREIRHGFGGYTRLNTALDIKARKFLGE